MSPAEENIKSERKGKAAALGLSLPYDWSNPEIPDDALIAGVLQREVFRDVCIVCMHYGIEKTQSVYDEMVVDGTIGADLSQIPRMLKNIQVGFAREG